MQGPSGENDRAPMNRCPFLSLVLVALLTAGCTTTAPVRPADSRTEDLVSNYVQLGIEYMKQGQYDVAMKRLERALSIDGTSPDAHNAMALLHDQLDQDDLAEAHYEKALRHDPKYAAAHNNYGGLLCRQGRYAEAERQFLLAGENPLNQNRDTAYTNAGLCVRQQGDLAKAETYFRKALELNPRQPVALMAMARLSFARDRFLQARAYLQRYAEVAPRTAESLWLGYRVERELGDRDAASSYAVALRGRFPDSQEARLLSQEEGR